MVTLKSVFAWHVCMYMHIKFTGMHANLYALHSQECIIRAKMPWVMRAQILAIYVHTPDACTSTCVHVHTHIQAHKDT
jgi:hypothetical protein